MIAYYSLIFSVAALGLLFCQRKPSKQKDIIFLCVVSIGMIVMSSLRAHTVGIDYDAYAEYFQKVCTGGAGFVFSKENTYLLEIGYSLLNYLVSLFTKDTLVFMSVISVLMVGLTAVAVYRYSSSVWVATYIFISFGFFGYSLCTIRQQLAATVFLFALHHLQNKKLVPYLFITLLAATFHISLLIMIPFYFIAWIPMNWKTMAVYSGGTLLILLFSMPILQFVTTYILPHYKGYLEGDQYFLQGRDIYTAFIPIVLFIVAMLLKKRLLGRNPKNLVLLNFSGYAFFLFVLTLKHFVFQRFALIFLPAAIFLVPEILGCLEPDIAKLEALDAKAETKGNKKQLGQQRGKMKNQLRDAKYMYYAAIGFILVGGLTYYMFILNANRLWLVPYIGFWQA